MRKLYLIAGLLAVGGGLAGWASLGTAQPAPVVAPGDRFAEVPDITPPPGLLGNKPAPPMPKPLPNDPFKDELTPPVKVSDPVPDIKVPKAPAEPPVRVLEPLGPTDLKLPDMKLPDMKAPDTKAPPVKMLPDTAKPPVIKEPITTDIKPPVVKDTFGSDIKPTAAVKEETPLNISGTGNISNQPSMSKQEPSVSLEWLGPTALKVGTPAEYTLMVRNTCAIPVQKVVVQVRVPSTVKIGSTEPKADGAEGVLLWEMGTLLSRQEKQLKIRMVPPGKGDINCQAWVTFTGSAAMRIQVREPKLLIKAQAPEKVLVGDAANVVLTVSNPGDFQAETVKVAVSLGEGLESARGNKASFDIGILGAGETRTVTIPCVAKVSGAQKCEAYVEGDAGLKALDSVNLSIIQPRLDLEATGPKLRYLDRKATYAFKVTNPGDAPAVNVVVTEMIPAGFKFISADNGGQHDFATRTVKWFVGEIPAGQTKEVKTDLMAVGTGDFNHKVMASAARGIKTEKDITTKVEGLSAMLMEVLDTEDPVEVKADTAYEIRITNTGSKFENDVKLVCTIPPQMKFKDAQGPVKYEIIGNEVVFQTLPKLAPRADASFKVIVTAVAKGDARFKATLTSGGLTEPVTKQESTRVYED
ncbi:CARDB domain-containing protein [Zavarzinella formosa]|uniref:CARDB domain-containing protein n=1 Tax=Zavarzinella formosa TaxID=360055 RepID=UPI000314A196|nr:CARDB domain-containing protein [Zavarzinella formosa]